MTSSREVTLLATGLAIVFCAAAGCAHSGQSAADWREADDPNSVLNKDRPALDAVDEQSHDQALRAAESDNPNSVDSRLPSAHSILQRLEAFNQTEMEQGRLAEQRGGARVSSFGVGLQQERASIERDLRQLAGKLTVDLQDLSDRRAVAQRDDNRETLEQLQQLQAGQFDLRFAQQIEREERKQLDSLTSLRRRCVEPRVCSLIDRMIPVLDGDESAARSLSASLAQSASAP